MLLAVCKHILMKYQPLTINNDNIQALVNRIDIVSDMLTEQININKELNEKVDILFISLQQAANDINELEARIKQLEPTVEVAKEKTTCEILGMEVPCTKISLKGYEE